MMPHLRKMPFLLVLPLLVAASPRAQTLLMGSRALHPCSDAPGFFCGSIIRRLDPARQVPGRIRIRFMVYPHTERTRAARGAILAMEGGPGYPSGGSHAAYLSLFRPLLRTRDLVLVDDRGTGGSGALSCAPLQRAPIVTAANVTRCGAQLGRRADLYGTAIAVDDVAAVLDALHVGEVDVYGDSYGTFAAQTFAYRHPRHIRTIVLDGAYPPVGEDPWLPGTAPEMRRAFAGALPAIDRLLTVLRRRRA